MSGQLNHWSIDLYEDDEGWFRATCNCGWSQGGVYPTAEDACDALMEHAFQAGLAAGSGGDEEA